MVLKLSGHYSRSCTTVLYTAMYSIQYTYSGSTSIITELLYYSNTTISTGKYRTTLLARLVLYSNTKYRTYEGTILSLLSTGTCTNAGRRATGQLTILKTKRALSV